MKARVIGLVKMLGCVTLAYNIAGVPAIQHYAWMKNDPDYAAAIDAAKEEACDKVNEAILTIVHK